ncbi:MAG: nucleotidyltransferase family protein [Elusimicrobia bacterium]|nr:nucleotidyltransferase family protein [Elusimicrobiota bacterium]
MKAFVLAAGVGSRLRPLTDALPKALLPVGGVPMLERTAVRLRDAGVSELVVNAHHHAERVAAFCADLAGRLGVRIDVSREDALLLDTGGGLKKAAPLLSSAGPFFVHNADVLSDLDLRALMAAHRASGALATLACRGRPSSRLLLFAPDGRLAGRRSPEGVEWAREPRPDAEALGFDGISVLSPELLPLISEEGVFPLTRPWLRLAGAGREIRLFRADRWAWHDVGSPERLAAAEAWASRRG